MRLSRALDRSRFLATTGLSDAVAQLRALLFGAGEQGWMYDNTNPATMWQDLARTVPVTATGQPVRFQDDLRLGTPTLGAERVTNGDFSNGATGWAADAGWTVTGGQAVFSGSTAANLVQNIASLVAGAIYQVEFDVGGYTGTLDLRLGQGGAVLAAVPPAFSGRFRVNVAASVGGTSLVLRHTGGAGGAVTIDNISVRALPGNHRFQPTTDASRPLYTADANGRLGLRYDGTDDWLQTGTITPGTDKVQLFGVYRKLSDAAQGCAVEFSAGSGSGRFAFFAPSASLNDFDFVSVGTAAATVGSAVAAPATRVIASLSDISGDLATLRLNGTQVAQSTADQGAGNFLAYPAFFGRRNGATLSFNGHSLGIEIVRFGPNLTLAQIQQVETLLNQIAGVY